jgi:hypothetical protein
VGRGRICYERLEGLQAASDLEPQLFDHDFGGLLLTLLMDQRFDVALEQELVLASGAHFEMLLDVGPLLVVYLPVKVEIEAG